MKINPLWLLLCLLPLATTAQKNTSVRLKWNLAPGDTLRYLTRMESLDTPKEDDSFNFLAALAPPEVLVSELTLRKPGVVEVEMYPQPSDEAEERRELHRVLDEMMARDSVKHTQSWMDSLHRELDVPNRERQNTLVGSVFADGGVASFYLPSGQKNILALFFELPKQPVRQGDTWGLDVQLIDMAASRCDSAFARHLVTCKAVEKRGTEQVVVLQYDFSEYFKGYAVMGDTEMALTFEATAEFSVQQGRWLSYEGVMSVSTDSFFGKSSTRQRFALTEAKF